MYGIYKELTKNNIYNKVDSYAIFKRYCDGFEELGKQFKSPLREDDKHPSASIIFYKGDLYFKDFGKGGYRAIDFIMEKYNLSYYEALQKINADFNLKLGSATDKNYEPVEDYTLYNYEYDKTEKKPCVINIKTKKYTKEDAEFWFGRYRITEKTLNEFDVFSISNFTIDDYLYFADKLSYSYNYYWENEVFRRKIYQPESWNKWYSNGGLVVQGEKMLPRNGELLIITSSLKDVMALYEIGYTAIAPTSESTFVPEKYFAKQHDRFKRIVLFMDSDEAGIIANVKLSEKWKLPYILINHGYGAKDISDLIRKYGQTEALKFLNEKNLLPTQKRIS